MSFFTFYLQASDVGETQSLVPGTADCVVLNGRMTVNDVFGNITKIIGSDLSSLFLKRLRKTEIDLRTPAYRSRFQPGTFRIQTGLLVSHPRH
jgi:hypothetical protein